MLSVCAEAIVPSSFGWMEWDVTNHVKDAIREGLSNIDYLIKDKNSGTIGVVFNSKENDNNQPKLVVNSVSISAVKDTYIYSFAETTNGSNTTIAIIEKSGDTKRGFISFPITDLSRVTSCTLRLYYSSYISSNPSGRTIQVYKCTQPNWVESQATWKKYKTGSYWTTAGGDYVAEVEDLPVASSAPPQRIWPAEYPRLYP